MNPVFRLVSSCRRRAKAGTHKLTRTMRHDPLLLAPSLHPPGFHLQPLQGVERAPRLERPDALQVLALEPQPQHRPGGRPPLPPRPREVLGRAGRRRELRERPVGEDGGEMDVGLDELVGFYHGGAGEGQRGG
jgi:hypothetical protein